MLQVQAIDHIVLRTSAVAEMIEFYCGVLNCSVEREVAEIGLIQLRAGSALIDLVPVDSELGKLGGGPPSQDGRNVDHICLLIQRVSEDELLGYLRSHGIVAPQFADRYGAQGHGRSIYVEDPENNVIELKLALS